jgi:HNH endonuclease
VSVMAKACVTCGKMHKAATEQCRACLFADQPDQECITCGATFPAADSKKCWRCRQTIVPKPCLDCGKTFTGSARRCQPCRAVERQCTDCRVTFRDRAHKQCSTCRQTTRPCDGCGRTIRVLGRRCNMCLAVERDCHACGRRFKGTTPRCNSCEWLLAPDYEGRLIRGREAVRRRRAMRLERSGGSLVPDDVLARIIADGPCVYCAQPATETDHVRPLIAGGLEHESNIVGSCMHCNRSKGPRLLTEWARPERVAHGVATSEKVAAEWARLVAVSAAS